MLRLGLASPQEVDRLWPTLREGFLKSTQRGVRDISAGQLWQLCRSGAAYLVLAYDDDQIYMASVWQFRSEECRHSFHCLSLYGRNMRDWLPALQDFVANLARENGATRLTACGRLGWIRLTPNAVASGDYYEVDI
jgi:hypothetical protein